MRKWDTDTELKKQCVVTYGGHDMKIVQFGKIGYAIYCQLCGEGEWHNSKKELRLEEGIHVFTALKNKDNLKGDKK